MKRSVLSAQAVPMLLILLLLPLLTLIACSADEDCPLNPEDPSKYVIVGFWSTTDCSGEPVAQNAFPVNNDDGCYCWPGHSGENSADSFSCDPENLTFTYTQYGSLTCGEDDNSPTVKTIYSDQCQQDIPPTLYARIIDYGACGS